MTELLSIDSFLPASKTVLALKQFIEGDVLFKVLSEVGDAELSAASKIFKNLDSFNDRQGAVNRALGHLESAHELFSRTASSAFHSLENGISLSLINAGEITECQYKDLYVCILMALCHRYLNDEKKIIEKKLNLALHALKFYSISQPEDSFKGISIYMAKLPLILPTSLVGYIRMKLNSKQRFYYKCIYGEGQSERIKRLIEEVRANLLST